MKKNISLLVGILFVSIFFVRCDRNVRMTNVEISIINNSGKPIHIFDYEPYATMPTTVFKISTGDTISKNLIQSEREATKGPHDFFSGDSLVIVFGNKEGLLTYKCPPSSSLEPCNKDGNILNLSDSRWVEEYSDGFIRRTYYFIPQDFEEAPLCEGNCD